MHTRTRSVSVAVEQRFERARDTRLEARERLAAREPVVRLPEREVLTFVDERFRARRRRPEVELAEVVDDLVRLTEERRGLRARCNGLETTMSEPVAAHFGREELALSGSDRSQRAVDDADVVLPVTQQHEPRRSHGKVTPSRASSARFSSTALRPPPYPPMRPPAATTR